MHLVVFPAKTIKFRMAKFNKMQVLAAMSKTGMIPVFYHKDPEVAKNVVKACNVIKE